MAQMRKRYEFNEITSKPTVFNIISDQELDEDFLEMKYSFGWQCAFTPNLCLLTEEVVVLGAGSIIVILNLKTGEEKLLPTVRGSGVAHVIVHPFHSQFTVAEKGINPTIDVFSYPDLQLMKLLRGGAEESYVYLDYDSSGNLLASLSSHPNYSLIIWKWEDESILLKTKAFSQDVWRVNFSSFLEGHLITGGVGHIKFWQMNRTFTGLKLQGEIGKFGHSDASDIHSFIQLPDGKVLTTSDWGNLLVWENGMIRTEISQSKGKSCHNGVIYQIILKNGELLTIGEDGFIKLWDSEAIEMMDPGNKKAFLEFKPLNEFLVKQNAGLRCITHPRNPSQENVWYAQGLEGYMWKLNLTLGIGFKPVELIRKFPSVEITGCKFCPVAHILAVSSKDGKLSLYNCLNNNLILSQNLHAPITSMIWAPKLLDRDGGSLLLGFGDGVVRWLVIKKEERPITRHDLQLHKAIKSHTANVTSFKINAYATHLASSSVDGTVFFYFVQGGEMKPLGFVELQHPIQWIIWLDKIDLIIAGGNEDFLAAVEVTKSTVRKDMPTYNLTDLRYCRIKLKSLELQEKVAIKLYKEKIPIEVNYDSKCTTEKNQRFSADLQSKEKVQMNDKMTESQNISVRQTKLESSEMLQHFGKSPTSIEFEEFEDNVEERYFCLPRKPFHITCSLYTGIGGQFWLSMGGSNKGFLYEYLISKEIMNLSSITIASSRIIHLPTSQFQLVTKMYLTPHRYYLVTGQDNGILTVYTLKRFTELGEEFYFTNYWFSSTHDCEKGEIKHISSSCDGKLLATAGDDGNIFLFRMKSRKYDDRKSLPESVALPISEYFGGASNIDRKALSLEEACKIELETTNQKRCEKIRSNLSKQMALLRVNFKTIAASNLTLPKHMQLNLVHNTIKEEIREAVLTNAEKTKERLSRKVKCDTNLCRKLQYKWKGGIKQQFFLLVSLLSNEKIHASRMTFFPTEGYEEIDFRELEHLKQLELDFQNQIPQENELENLFLSHIKDQIKGEDLDMRRSSDDRTKLTYESLVKLLRRNIGNYKLKIDSDYVPAEHIPSKAQLKKLQLKHLNLEVYQRRTAYNNQVLICKQWKENLLEKTKQFMTSDVSSKFYFEENRVLNDKSKEQLLNIQTSLCAHLCCREQSVDSKSIPFINSICPRGTEVQFKMRITKDEPLPSSDLDIPKKLELKEDIERQYISHSSYYEILKDIWMFDAQIHFQMLRRCCMDQELKYADIRRILFTLEYQILDKYDLQEEKLILQRDKKYQEKKEIEDKIHFHMNLIRQKTEYISSLQKVEVQINENFSKLVDKSNKHFDLLNKFFKRKIYLHTSEGKETDEKDDYDDEIDDDEADLFSSDDFDDFDWNGTSCPTGCDQNLFESVRELSQQQYHLQSKIKEAGKLQETYNKELENLSKKLKWTTNLITPTEKKQEGIKVRKQKAINRLNMVISVFFDQIQHCTLKVPEDLQWSILAPCQIITNLKRLAEFTKQSAERKQIHKGFRLKQSNLSYQCEALTEKIEKLNEEAETKMMAKFGQVVDLKRLSWYQTNPEIEELNRKQTEARLREEKSIKEWKAKEAERRQAYCKILAENTKKIQILAALKSKSLQLDTNLSNRQKFTFQFKKK